MKKNYLVTGASGFLGSHVADFLSLKKFNVILFDKRNSNFKKKNQKMIIGNINNQHDLIKATKNINTVFHFAASADLKISNDNPFKTIESNILGTVKLVKACKKNKVHKIVYASSIYAISEQGGIYSASKLSSEIILERLCKKFRIKFVILRFGTVYGERANEFNTIRNFIDTAVNKKKIYRSTKGNEIRSYIHIEDVTKIVFESTKKKYNNGYYNIFGPKKMSVKKMLNTIKKFIPNLRIYYSKYDKKMYNYKVNPFTYKLRKGKKIILNKYIDVETGLFKLIKQNNHG